MGNLTHPDWKNGNGKPHRAAGPLGGHPQCTATSKQSGQRCKQPAIVGGTVCVYHGGKAPQVQGAADRRIIEAGESIKDMLPAATRELKRLVEGGKAESVRLKAVEEVLDRAGLAVVRKNEVKVSQGEYTFVIAGPDSEDEA